MNIVQNILPISPNTRPGTIMVPRWIVVHETDNTDKGADANAHARYLLNVSKAGTPYVSWHYTVDENQIIQHIPDNEIAWHAGDWGKDKVEGGNARGIGIELCVNAGSDFNKVFANAVWLVAFLCKKYNFTVDGVARQHFDFTGKNCPATIRATGRWTEFKSKVTLELNSAPTVNPDFSPNATVDCTPENSANTYATADVKLSSGSVWHGERVQVLDPNKTNNRLKIRYKLDAGGTKEAWITSTWVDLDPTPVIVTPPAPPALDYKRMYDDMCIAYDTKVKDLTAALNIATDNATFLEKQKNELLAKLKAKQVAFKILSE